MEEKLEGLFQESRMIAAVDNVIFPMLEKLKSERVVAACARFTLGEKDFVADIAYIQGLKDFENRIRKLQTAGNKANYELNKELIK